MGWTLRVLGNFNDGVIPIVKKNNLVLNFEKFDIPILIFDDYEI